MRGLSGYLSSFWQCFFVLAAGWFVAGFLSPSLVMAQKAEVTDLVVNNTKQDLVLYFSLDHAFRPEMEEGIDNGIPATFTFYVTLNEVVNEGGGRRAIASLTFDHTLSFDSLKQEYRVKCSERQKTIAAPSRLEGKKLMNRVDGVRIASLGILRPGQVYVVDVKARLERKTLPLFFHYLIPFWQLLDFDTDWNHVTFRY
ncbi:MAG: DUF4390 domain-containing protein [Proteobacteria bacterium]|nr:DUF4390 domain-containing protein [Pseudomonadota bacterium]MBU1688949.1 DUF4390 domain-containing protein [Pseudomonadota bacterium]